MSATALRWFASDTEHIVFIHVPSVLKPVHIFMARDRVSKSCLMFLAEHIKENWNRFLDDCYTVLRSS